MDVILQLAPHLTHLGSIFLNLDAWDSVQNNETETFRERSSWIRVLQSSLGEGSGSQGWELGSSDICNLSGGCGGMRGVSVGQLYGYILLHTQHRVPEAA